MIGAKRRWRRQLFGACCLLGLTLVGCGEEEQKVMLPENPTPPPRPEERLVPRSDAPTETPPAAPSP